MEREKQTVDESDIGTFDVHCDLAGEARIVEAVGVAASGRSRALGQAIESAMSQAVLEAMKEGITDPDAVRAMKLAARARVKALFAEAEQQAADAARKQADQKK